MTSHTINKARATIVLDHPFFASILLRHPMIEDKSIDACCVNGEGRIRYNPAFFDGLTNNQAVWALCHEIGHYVGMDGLRVGTRDKKGWNKIADEWINDMLAKANIGEAIPGTLRKPGASDKTREQLYAEWEAEEKPPCGGGGEGDGDGEGAPPPPAPAPGDGNGDGPMSNDNEPSKATSQSEVSESEARVKMEVAEAAQTAKMRGNLPGVLQKMAAEIIDSQVPWYDVLERHMTERVKHDITWRRPNRRYMPHFYLPTIDGVGAMGEMAVQVDISGSVSAKEIHHYNGHLKRIIEQCRPTKVHVIYTDTAVQLHEEFENPEDVEITYHRGGGTDMVEGFRFLERMGIAPVVMVTLTDGYTPFPEVGEFDIPAIWCISSDKVSPSGETISFKMEY